MSLGELALNYDANTGGVFYKDSAGSVVKVGPVQVSPTEPNVEPVGSSGNSQGEGWLDTTNNILKVYNGTAWQNPVPNGSTSVVGIVQLTDSISSTSTSTAATPNSVKSAYDAATAAQATAGAALPKAGGAMTGDITFAGTQNFPTSGIQAASTTQPGVVQLNDTTSSTSTTEALTANQGKELQDQINALSVASNITLAGTIDASTGLLVTVTSAATQHGDFVVGDPLPTADNQNEDYFVIVTTPGTMTPPGGSAQECHQGDWWLSNGNEWEFLDVGFNATYATTATPGVVQLATDAEVQAGVNTNHAVTSSGLQSKVSDSTSTTSSTAIASSTAVKSAYDAGIQGQTDASAAQATADAALPASGGVLTGSITFAAGQTFPVGGIQDGTTSQKGVVQLSDSTSSTSTTLAATANVVKSAYDAGVQGQADAAVALAAANTAGTNVGTLASLTTTDKSSAVAAINEVNAAASAAQADATQALSDASAAQSDADQAILDAAAAQGDATQALSDAASAQTAANNAQSDATQALSDAAAAQSDATQALSDAAAAQATADAAVPDASYTALGDILSGTGAGTYSALPLGTNTQVLTVDTTCSGGVKWAAGGGGTVTSITAGTGLTGGTITSTGTIALDTACVIQPSALTAKGDIITATAASTPTALGVGTDGQVLSACSTCSSGLVWATPAAGVVQITTSNSYAFQAGVPVQVLNFGNYNSAIDGTLSIPLRDDDLRFNAIWKFVKSGGPFGLNTGWNPYFSWPNPYAAWDPGYFTMLYPMILEYTPANSFTVPMTLVFTVISGAAPTWMI